MKSSPPAAATADLRVHIERVIVSGAEVRDRAALAAAVQSEIQLFLAERGWRGLAGGARAEPRIDGGAFRAASPLREEEFGRQIAHAVYGGLTR